MNSLRTEVNVFTRDVLRESSPPDGLSPFSVQYRFLHAQCLSARETAVSYWILRDAERFHDSHILARNLLERFFLCRLAASEPNQAAALICAEIRDRKRRLNEWPVRSAEVKRQLTQMLNEQDRELAIFEPIAGSTVAPPNIFGRAEKIGAEHVYRTLYWHFCRFSYPSYDTSRPEERDRIIPRADAVALYTPLDAAWHLHMIIDGRTPCEIDERYDKISRRIRNAFQEKEGEQIRPDNAS